jgi:hypothetical protein
MSSPLLENVVKAVSPSMHKKLFPMSSNSSSAQQKKHTVSSNLKPPKGGAFGGQNSVTTTTTATTTLLSSSSSGEKKKRSKEESSSSSDEDEEENEEPQCTPEKEQVNEILPKSPHKSALKPLELRLAARFGQDSPRRKSISFANEEEFQVKLIPKNKTGTPEVTCMISGSLKRKIGEAERLAQESWGLPASGKRERKPSRISFTCNKTSSNNNASTPTPASTTTSSNGDKESANNNKKPRRSSVSFKPACSDDDTTPPTRKSGARKVQDTPATKKSHNSNMTPSPSSSIETTKTNKTAPLTSGGLKSRPQAPNNTPANTNGNEIFSLEGFDLFRSTPNAKAIRDALFETKEEDEKDDIAASKCLDTCEKLLASQPPAMELAQALEKLAEPQVTPGRAVMEWLSDAENHSDNEEEEFEEDKENAKTPPSSTKSNNDSPATICIKAKKSKKTKKTSKKMKKSKKEKSMSYVLAMKFEQLHNALEQTQLALLKERKKTMKLRKLLLEAAERENNKVEEKVSTLKRNTEEKTEEKKSDANDTTCVLCNEINDAVKVTMRCVKCNSFAHGKCCKPALRRAPKEWTCSKCS